MRRSAFTLIELLVVIAIVALLATIVLPMANHAYAVAKRAALGADLQIIANAIDAYEHDWGDIPRPSGMVTPPWQGGGILCWALIAPGPASATSAGIPGDGADGPGFRIRGTTGTVIGPYLPLDHFTIGVTLTTPPANDSRPLTTLMPVSGGAYDNRSCRLGDRAGNVVFYFPRKLKASIVDINTYLGPLSVKPAYVANDNDPGLAVVAPGHPPVSIGGPTGSGNLWAIQQLQLRLPGVVPDQNGNPTLPDPSQALRMPYLLWDTGPDGRFGTDDDVTNFSP